MMEINGNTIILEAGEEVTIKAREKEGVVPTPTPPSDETVGRLDLLDLIGRFNNVLTDRGYNAINVSMEVYDILRWQYGFAEDRYDNYWAFKPSTYPLLYDYRGEDKSDAATAYNAMQAWMMAMSLAELVPDSGETTNTQTEIFKMAYEIGGGRNYPLYNYKALIADTYAMREVGSVIQSICRGDINYRSKIDLFRDELGGHPIEASCWEELGYKNEKLFDSEGRCIGYETKSLGYLVNTELFLPDAPGPRVPGTTVCDLPFPWEQGQAESLFNPETGNYLMDEVINDYFVMHYDMMSLTPLDVWNSYPIEKQNRMVNVAAIPPCTFMYMLGKAKNVRFDGKQYKSYDGKIWADYFSFSETSEGTGLVLDGPFSNLAGIFRYNALQLNERERFIRDGSKIVDNFRFPTEDPNYGRCRPGCKPTLDGGELNPDHGADENEVYNVDLTAMVADTAKEREDMMHEDGFAADSPRSYVSGHSAQIWALALILTQADNDNTERSREWVHKAYEYSVNRSVGRFHWNSDCIYGRLFGTMAVPVLRAMTGLQEGYEAVRKYVLNPQPEPEPTGDYSARIIIRNETGAPIQSTGEIRLYVRDHIGIDANLPGWVAKGVAYTFDVGDSVNDTTLLVHDDNVPPVDFDGEEVNEVRFYDYRHYNNIDAGFNAVLDLDDPECCSVIENGATYVIRITNIE